ncbi:hypothetical protein ACFQ0M_08145 [Kitasatospora aburaviensis]
MATADLAFHPLTFVTERDGTLVGRPDTGSFALLPEDGAALLRRLADGMPLAEAAAWYDAVYGEPVDLADFIETMRDLGFVQEPGAAAEPVPVRLQAWGRAMFSPLGWSCYALITALAIAAMIYEPRLQPHTRNLFFVPSLVAVEVTLAALQMPLMLWHEGWHVLAGRRLGLPTGLGIGRRLYFVVFETRLDALFGVRPAQRPALPGRDARRGRALRRAHPRGGGRPRDRTVLGRAVRPRRGVPGPAPAGLAVSDLPAHRPLLRPRHGPGLLQPARGGFGLSAPPSGPGRLGGGPLDGAGGRWPLGTPC